MTPAKGSWPPIVDFVARSLLFMIASFSLCACTEAFDIKIVSVARVASADATPPQSGDDGGSAEVIRIDFKSTIDILTEATARNVPDVVFYLYPCGGPDRYKHVGPIAVAKTGNGARDYYASVPGSWGKLTVSTPNKGFVLGWPNEIADQPLCFQIFGQNMTMSGLVSREATVDGINELLK